MSTKNAPADIRYSQEEIRHKEQQQQQQKLYQDQIMSVSKNNHNNSNISLTTTGGNNSVNYSEHLYDSTKIRTDDVPLLTDQFAPVENLLNPITSQPYNIE